MKKKIIYFFLAAAMTVAGCGNLTSSLSSESSSVSQVSDLSSEKTEDETGQLSEAEEKEEQPTEVTKVELTKNYKIKGNTNPIMTQSYGADPFALVYEDTVYIYMTQDAYEYDAGGNIKENSYSKINTIHVVATKDMKNFKDCGEIKVAGPNGAAKWAHNSWAPAAAVKNINGKDKFFLYFADNGGGIGVLSADSPTGPFEDPLGHALISRDVPNCASVLWLFDPAVLVDDDGTGYIYFGGGVPEGKVSAPGTARCAKLGDDMISLATDPVAIDVPYLFEDSGIHKFGNKYYYTYCVNWSVDEEGEKKYGFSNAVIACMESENPLGPFTFKEVILDNPGKMCGVYGNNHHAVFKFKDNYYICYHSRQLEKNKGITLGYRATHIDCVNIAEDGTIGRIKQTNEGPAQLVYVNPYEANSAVCTSQMAGTNAVPVSENPGYGDMILGEINTGDYIEITGVDFGEKGATELSIKANVPQGTTAKIHLRLDFAGGSELTAFELKDGETTVALPEAITGIHYVYFVFEGEGYTVSEWSFK